MGELLRRNQAEFVRERVMELKSIASSAVEKYRQRDAKISPAAASQSLQGESVTKRTINGIAQESPSNRINNLQAGEVLESPTNAYPLESTTYKPYLKSLTGPGRERLVTDQALASSNTIRGYMYRANNNIQPSRWSTLKRRLLDIFSKRVDRKEWNLR